MGGKGSGRHEENTRIKINRLLARSISLIGEVLDGEKKASAARVGVAKWVIGIALIEEKRVEEGKKVGESYEEQLKKLDYNKGEEKDESGKG